MYIFYTLRCANRGNKRMLKIRYEDGIAYIGHHSIQQIHDIREEEDVDQEKILMFVLQIKNKTKGYLFLSKNEYIMSFIKNHKKGLVECDSIYDVSMFIRYLLQDPGKYTNVCYAWNTALNLFRNDPQYKSLQDGKISSLLYDHVKKTLDNMKISFPIQDLREHMYVKEYIGCACKAKKFKTPTERHFSNLVRKTPSVKKGIDEYNQKQIVQDLCELLDNYTYRKRRIHLQEILMSMGKTSVIIPYLVYHSVCTMPPNNICIVVVPEHLLQLMYSNLLHAFGYTGCMHCLCATSASILGHDHNYYTYLTEELPSKDYPTIVVMTDDTLKLWYTIQGGWMFKRSEDKGIRFRFFIDEVDYFLSPLHSKFKLSKKSIPFKAHIGDLINTLLRAVQMMVELYYELHGFRDVRHARQYQAAITQVKSQTDRTNIFQIALLDIFSNHANLIVLEQVGFSDTNNKMEVVPYNGLNKPLSSSSYSNPLVRIAFTIITLYTIGLPKKQHELWFKKKIRRFACPLWGVNTRIHQLEHISLRDYDQATAIRIVYNYICTMIYNIYIPSESYDTNFIKTIFNFPFDYAFMFTGTLPDLYAETLQTQINTRYENIEFKNIMDTKGRALIRETLTTHVYDNRCIPCSHGDDMYAFIRDHIQEVNGNSHHQYFAVMDIRSALLIPGIFTVEDMVRRLGALITCHRPCRYVYINNKDAHVYYDPATQIEYDFVEIEEEYVYIYLYDGGHIIGVDIRQSNTEDSYLPFQGIMLTDDNCEYNTVSQAAFRLRNIHRKFHDEIEGEQQELVYIHVSDMRRRINDLVDMFLTNQDRSDARHGQYMDTCIQDLDPSYLEDIQCVDSEMIPLEDRDTYINTICTNIDATTSTVVEQEHEVEHAHEHVHELEHDQEVKIEKTNIRTTSIDIRREFIYQIQGTSLKIRIVDMVLTRLQNKETENVVDSTVLLFDNVKNTVIFFPLHEYYNISNNFRCHAKHLESLLYTPQTTIVFQLCLFLFFSGFVNNISECETMILTLIDYPMAGQDITLLKQQLEGDGISHCFENMEFVYDLLTNRGDT
jgi:hypothetical protein